MAEQRIENITREIEIRTGRRDFHTRMIRRGALSKKHVDDRKVKRASENRHIKNLRARLGRLKARRAKG